MTLAAHSRIGSYEIVSRIGAGGMGEVFRARDTKLGRDVAIKVLPAAYAADRERVARFRREAQLVASLNHPNIAAIYGLEESDGAVALALELVSGDDLAQRLKHGAIPVDEVIAMARQIAEGLEAAHEKGIVHRDLKPANVKLTDDGTVKILDFGLAKAFEGENQEGSNELSQSPTISRPMTAAGMILGTAAYMSPEQARGKTVDKRSDIWSFGVMLFEMLTGRRLFTGETISDTLAAVLREEVDLQALPAETPQSLRRILERCLERDPKKRLRDIGEVRVALSDPSGSVSSIAPQRVSAAAASPSRRPSLWIPALLALTIAALGIWAGSRFRTPAPQGVTRLNIALPPGLVLVGPGAPAITRDGRTIAYAARDGSGVSRLFIRQFDRFESMVVPESEGAQQPFFSPDGGRVAFFARAKLMTAPVSGDAPTPIADVTFQPFGGSWSDDDKIVFVPSLAGGLLRVSSAGGRPEQLTEPDGKGAGYAHVFPHFLPGGDRLVFTMWAGSDVADRGIELLSLQTRRWTHLASNTVVTRYVPPGYLLVSGARGVKAALFDLKHPQAVAPSTFVLTDLFWSAAVECSWFSVSDTGTLVYVPGDATLGMLSWVDREGRVTPIDDQPESIMDPNLSPDGTRAALEDRDNVLWVVDLNRKNRTRLTGNSDDGNTSYQIWSRDGAHVIFGSNRGGDWDLYSAPAAGGSATRILARKGNQFPLSVAPDGSVLFSERALGGTADLWTLAPDGKASPFLVSRASKVGGQFSPDGKTVAYVSDETGRDEVYIHPFDRPGQAMAVSTQGGSAPKWSPDGKEIFYRRGDSFLVAGVNTNAPLTVGESKKMFDLRAAYGRGTNHPGYDVSPDGKRFLVQQLDARATPTQINVVLNWVEELKTKVPK